jgi:hypothetical protein
MKHKLSAKEYEEALFEKLLYDFRPPLFQVTRNDRTIKGRHSGVKRQLDVAVYRVGRHRPFLVADAKRRGRAIDVGRVECFIGQLDDVGVTIGVMASPSGFSRAAERRAAASDLSLFVMNSDEALEMNWRRVARKLFPWDWAFHPQLAAALLHLDKKHEASEIADALEGVPFDEWCLFVGYGVANQLPETELFLWFVALHHQDSGWRFNAIQQLVDLGSLAGPDVARLVSREQDPEILELLREAGLS